jgi:hypothetical protein
MRTPWATLPHESLFFDNPESFRAQNERCFSAGRRTRSRSPRVSALAVCADAIPAEMCYLGWQESLVQLSNLVEPEIPGGE